MGMYSSQDQTFENVTYTLHTIILTGTETRLISNSRAKRVHGRISTPLRCKLICITMNIDRYYLSHFVWSQQQIICST